LLLALTAGADDSLEQKKVDKRGLLGLGYGYGHNLAYVPAVSYTKVSDRQIAMQSTDRRGLVCVRGRDRCDSLTRVYTRGNCCINRF
jgi:hypothetical protein